MTPIEEKIHYWVETERHWLYQNVVLRSHIEIDPTTRAFEVLPKNFKYLERWFTKKHKGEPTTTNEYNTPISRKYQNR